MTRTLSLWQSYLLRPVSSQGFHLMRRLWALAVFITMIRFAPRLFTLFAAPQNWSQVVYHHPYRVTLFLFSDRPAVVACVYALMMLSCIALFFGRYAKLAMPIALVGFISFFERNLMPFHSETSMLSSFGFLALLFTYVEDPKHTMPIVLWRLLVWQVVIMYVSSVWYKLLSPAWITGDAIHKAFLYHSVSPTTLAPIAASFPTLFIVLTYLVLLWEFSWLFLLLPQALCGTSCTTKVRRTLLLSGIVMHASWAMLLSDVYILSLSVLAAYAGLLQKEDFVVLRAWLRAKTSRR